MKLRELSMALESLSDSFRALIDLYYDRRIFTTISEMQNQLQVCHCYPTIVGATVVDGTILQLIDRLFQQSCMFSFHESALHVENVVHGR